MSNGPSEGATFPRTLNDVLQNPEKYDVFIVIRPDGKQVAVDITDVKDGMVYFKKGVFDDYIEITGLHIDSQPVTCVAITDFARLFVGMEESFVQDKHRL